MIFDSVEQKNYVIQCVSSCREWTHQQSLQLSQKFDLAIQNGEVIPVEPPKVEGGSDPKPEGMTPPKPHDYTKINQDKNKRTPDNGRERDQTEPAGSKSDSGR